VYTLVLASSIVNIANPENSKAWRLPILTQRTCPACFQSFDRFSQTAQLGHAVGIVGEEIPCFPQFGLTGGLSGGSLVERFSSGDGGGEGDMRLLLVTFSHT
jgi:hypothetical protein